MAHAKYAPSKMQRTVACPASTIMEAQYPNTQSDFADEGTVAHDMGAKCLRDNLDSEQFVGMAADVDANGVVSWEPGDAKFKIDEEFAQYVQVYLNEVRRRAYGNLMLVEQKVWFNVGEYAPMQSGTADVIIYDRAKRQLIIIDLKFGKGVKVFAVNMDGSLNEQMTTYALAVLETLADELGPVDEVVMVICQPRLDHLDETPPTPVSVIQAFSKKIANAVAQSEVAEAMYLDGKKIPDIYFNPGEKQCTFCKHKTCDALDAWVSQEVMNDMKTLSDPNTAILASGPPPISKAKLGARWANKGLVEVYLKSLVEITHQSVNAGEQIIGPDGKPLKFVAGNKGHRYWPDPKKAEAALAGQLTPDKLYEPQTIITPSAADKLLNKKATKNWWKDAIVPLIKQPDGKPILVLGSDPRPAFTTAATDAEFEDMSMEDI